MSSKRMESTLVVFAALAALAWGGPATARIPNEFTNLKVFPKDVGKQELVGAMREFSLALGVRCVHCHVMKTPGDFDSIEWASDELDAKKTARKMLKMVSTVNADLLPGGSKEDGPRVRCVTCHRGLKNPATLDRVLLQEYSTGGAEAAIARYHGLREEYYGSGSYDFGPRVLAEVAEELVQDRGDTEGALAILKLNVEQHPDSADAHLMLARLLAVSGDPAGAAAGARRVLELDPENRQAKQLLDQLEPDGNNG